MLVSQALRFSGLVEVGEDGEDPAVACVVVVPVAITDSIPGALPPWFVALQIVGAVTLIPAAFIVNRSQLRAALPQGALVFPGS
jgi:hypothetical protein